MWEQIGDDLIGLELNALAILARHWAKKTRDASTASKLRIKIPEFRRAVIAGEKGSKKIPFEIVRDYFVGLEFGLSEEHLLRGERREVIGNLQYALPSVAGTSQTYSRSLPLANDEIPGSTYFKKVNKSEFAKLIIRKRFQIGAKTISRAINAKYVPAADFSDKNEDVLRTLPPTKLQALLIGHFLDLCCIPNCDLKAAMRTVLLEALSRSGYSFICGYYLAAIGSGVEKTLRQNHGLTPVQPEEVERMCAPLLRMPNKAVAANSYLELLRPYKPRRPPYCAG